jgi:hypothetical protein
MFIEIKEQGREEGIELATAAFVRNMLLANQLSVQEMASIANTTVDFVLKIKKEREREKKGAEMTPSVFSKKIRLFVQQPYFLYPQNLPIQRLIHTAATCEIIKRFFCYINDVLLDERRAFRRTLLG